jgi:hypothetical protein
MPQITNENRPKTKVDLLDGYKSTKRTKEHSGINRRVAEENMTADGAPQ